jgi:hypothetical protein
MNAPQVVVPLDARVHREAQALLPWFAAGTLDAFDRERVEAHLAECPHCQAELAFERRLQALHDAALPDAGRDDAAVERGLRRIEARLDAEPARAPWSRLAQAWRGWRGWRGASVALLRPAPLAAAFALVLALGAALALLPALPDRYRALGAASSGAARGSVVVMFRPGTSEAELRRALRAAGARIVDGPTPADAWVLDVPAGTQAAALAALRAQAAVALAEPLGAKGSP